MAEGDNGGRRPVPDEPDQQVSTVTKLRPDKAFETRSVARPLWQMKF